MEAFRRFRFRRKSKGQADAFTSYAEAETNYAIRPTVVKTPELQASSTKNSITKPRSALPANYEAQKASNVQRPPSSRDDRRPILGSLARPSLNISRPGTAESLQTALNRAAESVSPRLASSPLSQSTTRPSRYVDIMSVSRGSQSRDRTYNEDIAERNLDGSSLMGDEERFHYEPTSKYQEEVANRNAHQIAASRASSLRRPLEIEQSRTTARPASTQPGNLPRHTVNAPADYQHRPRQSSSRPREPAMTLPVIPQERSSEDFRGQALSVERVRHAEEDLERAKARWQSSRKPKVPQKSPNVDKPLPASPRRSQPLRDSGISYSQDAPYASLDKYGTFVSIEGDTQRRRQQAPVHDKPTAPELLRIPSNARETPLVTTNTRTSQADSQRDVRRPSHASSITPYKRIKVGNRTVMDLTGDEDGEAYSVASYLQTPVVESAQIDAFQKVVPTVIDHASPSRGSPVERDLVVPNFRWSHGFSSDASEPVLDLDQLARQSQHMLATATDPIISSSSVEKPNPAEARARAAPLSFSAIRTVTSSSQPNAIGFSNVATLTSTSPRNSREIDTSGETKVASNQQKSAHISTLTVPQPTGAQSRLSADITPMVQVLTDVKPQESGRLNSGVEARSDTVLREAKSTKPPKDSKASAERAERRRKKAEEVEAILRAAKSSIPAGPLDNEPLPGVKTRDFATTRAEKASNIRPEAVAVKKTTPSALAPLPTLKESGSAKSSSSEKKGRLSKSTSKVSFHDTPTTIPEAPPKPPKWADRKSGQKKEKTKSSGGARAKSKPKYNDTAYQKKHEEANAALLRLQQSLQESFDNDTDGTETSTATIERALSPAGSVATLTPAAQSTPSQAAMAMIATATATSKTHHALHTKTSSDLGRASKPEKPALPVRAITENSIPTIHATVTKQAAPVKSLLLRLDSSNKPPPSPGEVSLSSFPLPTSRARSPEVTSNPPAYVKDPNVPSARPGSVASRASAASAFSIPSTMVPDRTGSLPQNRMAPPAPPVPSKYMNSIDSMIPQSSHHTPVASTG